jgi:1-acyl-sn-glycerol-3-phosphate acyltransferase
MLYEVMHTVVPPLAKAVWRPTVEGVENLPATGPATTCRSRTAW